MQNFHGQVRLLAKEAKYRCQLPHLRDQVFEDLLLLFIEIVFPYKLPQGVCHLSKVEHGCKSRTARSCFQVQ